MKPPLLLTAWVMTICLSLGVSLAHAGELDNQFFKANQQYAAGHYQEAADGYEEILRTGESSGPLYYNLGNTYFKLGQRGKAILNYERAHRLMPQDEDLLANLSFVGSLLEQAQPTDDLRWYEKILFNLRDLFSANGWAVVFLTGYSLLFAFLLLAIFVERIKKGMIRLAWFFACATVMCFAFAALKIQVTERSQEGVIVQKMVDVRYSPTLTGAVAFRLTEGIKAQVIRFEGNWCYIRLTRDKSGWVERATIEGI